MCPETVITLEITLLPAQSLDYEWNEFRFVVHSYNITYCRQFTLVGYIR